MDLNFTLYTVRLDCSLNYLLQYAYVDNLGFWLTNAFFNPWKADLIRGIGISEKTTLDRVRLKEKFDSGIHRHAFFRAKSAFANIIYTSVPALPAKGMAFWFEKVSWLTVRVTLRAFPPGIKKSNGRTVACCRFPSSRHNHGDFVPWRSLPVLSWKGWIRKEFTVYSCGAAMDFHHFPFLLRREFNQIFLIEQYVL